MLEILAPAGSFECALAGINNGANAIYLGLASSFSARQGAENFDETAFRDILRRAHLCGVKVYVALNTLVKAGTHEFENFLKDALFAWNEGADALILQDVFLGKLLHEVYPEIVLHLSTQAGVCNVEGAKFAKECGFTRVILARETPLLEIGKIAQILETEVFVQGALCTCFSGQCYFSSFAGGNSGNRGRCKQPCRKLYSYNRKGYEDKAYALSLSDLSVGENIQKLIECGVVSFKIEGRMRRAEYVAAAVRYYRSLLEETEGACTALSDLKRTYNRGNYTKGLAFGQDKRFLSTAIQGHLGEKVGVVKVINAKYFVESIFKPEKGDAFKILREGKEVGGAFYAKTETRGFVITSKIRLKNGDAVFITTDNALNKRLSSHEYKRKVGIELFFIEGEKAVALWNGKSIESDNCLQTAQKCSLTKEEIYNSFMKTDGLPIAVDVSTLTLNGNIFIPKSELNAFRRKVFSTIVDEFTNTNRTPLSIEMLLSNKDKWITDRQEKISNGKTAVLADDFQDVQTDVAIYKWNNLSQLPPENFIKGNFEKYIYYPAFLTGDDIEKIAEYCEKYHLNGIYADNYGGMTFAKENNVKVFAGTGFNITNEYTLNILLSYPYLSYFAISKELNERECQALSDKRGFVLAFGDIKIMDLCYCPFEKTCKNCDKRPIYQLTDESGRVFPVRRYQDVHGACRFEVFNCASLIGLGIKGVGKLIDLTLVENRAAAIAAQDKEEEQKNIFKNYTSGHFKRGVL